VELANSNSERLDWVRRRSAGDVSVSDYGSGGEGLMPVKNSKELIKVRCPRCKKMREITVGRTKQAGFNEICFACSRVMPKKTIARSGAKVPVGKVQEGKDKPPKPGKMRCCLKCTQTFTNVAGEDYRLCYWCRLGNSRHSETGWETW
jgi:hypothetical protein